MSLSRVILPLAVRQTFCPLKHLLPPAKSTWHLISFIVFSAGTLRAQLVDDGSTNVMANVTNIIAGGLTIGTNGPFTLLELADNCLLTNVGLSQIGENVTARSNQVRLVGGTARWHMLNPLTIGVNGSFNRMDVSNGAQVRNSLGSIGNSSISASNNTVAVTGSGSSWSNVTSLAVGVFGNGNRLEIGDGGFVTDRDGMIGQLSSGNLALVTSPNSLWSNATELTVGFLRGGNQLVLSNAGKVQNVVAYLGRDSASTNNMALVTGSGSVWNNQSNLYVGAFGSGNQLTVESSGLIVNSNGLVGSAVSSSNNVALITGGGSTWSNRNTLTVGELSVGNRLVVSNGGTVFTMRDRFSGSTNGANSNTILVTDPGSQWRGGSDSSLYLGLSGSFNRMVVSNGGAVFNVRLGYLGYNSGANSNLAVVTGSGSVWTNNDYLFIGNGGAGNQLIVTNGGKLYAGGLIIVGNNPTASNNTVLVTGKDSACAIPGQLSVGSSSRGNRLTVENGGALSIEQGAVIGFNTGSNQILVSGTNSVFTNASALTVGAAGSGNQFIVNTAALACANGVLLGEFSGSTNNRLVVDGATLSITNATGTAALNVRRGSNVFNAGLMDVDQLILTNGQGWMQFNGGTLISRGAVIRTNVPFVVGTSGSTPALWDVRAGVTNTSVAGDLIIGSSGSFHQLILTNGATLTNFGNSAFGILGRFSGANSNCATLSGAGSTWKLEDGLIIGDTGSANRLLVSNGATIVTSSSSFIGNDFVSANNEAVLTGPTTTWTSVPGDLILGYGGRNNRLLISDGARVVSSSGTLGSSLLNSTNNEALITGPGSLWSNVFDLVVGNAGAANRLTVSNNATVAAVNSVYLGLTPSSTMNALTVDGGTLRVTNASATARLDIRRGTGLLVAGLVEVDRLLITNTQGSFLLNGGTLSARSTISSNGNPFHVGNNVGPATFFMAGNGTHLFASSLLVDANASLTGNGTVGGLVAILNNGTLSPGAPIGKMVFNNTLLLSGTVRMEISKNGATLTNDHLQVIDPLTFGGALIVNKLGTSPLAVGDSFKLFTATVSGGSFSPLILPPLDPGLGWTNKLSFDGSIAVIAMAQPKFSTITATGSNLVFTGNGGSAGANYTILTSTNVAVPVSNWVSLATNQFSAGGEFSFTNSIAPGEPHRFFRIRTP